LWSFYHFKRLPNPKIKYTGDKSCRFENQHKGTSQKAFRPCHPELVEGLSSHPFAGENHEMTFRPFNTEGVPSWCVPACRSGSEGRSDVPFARSWLSPQARRNIVCATSGHYDALCGRNCRYYIFNYQAYMRNVIITPSVLIILDGENHEMTFWLFNTEGVPLRTQRSLREKLQFLYF
jgi:hypothetical protein